MLYILNMPGEKSEVTVMDEFLNRLWLNFHKALLNFIKKDISNPEDAEDILQNVFLKIHSNIHRLKEKDKVSSWLYQVTRNTVIDSFRANVKNKGGTLPLMDGKIIKTEKNDEEFWIKEIASFLMEMVENLPEKYRSVLKWHEFDGLTHQKIANRLGISVSGSKTRVQRSREKLKELLLCGCRSEVEVDRNRPVSSSPVCAHLVKMGPNNLCVKRLHNL